MIAGHNEISQAQVWPVILAFFKEKGLVRQQLDSYDKFVTTTIAEVVGDAQTLDLRPAKNYAPGALAEPEVRVPTCPPPLVFLYAEGRHARVPARARARPVRRSVTRCRLGRCSVRSL
jgi:hypothetical protein